MTRLAALMCLLSVPALAAPYGTVAVLNTPTNVTAAISSEFVGQTFRSIRIENGGSASIYCSRDPAVTTDTGNVVAAGGFLPFPYDGPIYCIAAVSQTGTGRDHTILWGSYQ